MLEDKIRLEGTNKYSLTLYSCLYIFILIVLETKKKYISFLIT